MSVRDTISYSILLAMTASGVLLLINADRLLKKQIQKTTEPKVVYRIMVEAGLEENQPSSAYTPQEQQAVTELKSMLANWPQRMWLTSVEGRLMLVKMGADGKPIGR